MTGALGACGEDTSSAGGEPVATESASETPSESASATPTPTPTPTPEPTESESVVATPTPSETTEPAETAAPPADGVPQTYADAMARFDALGQEPAAYRRFVTDTDIYCVLDDKALPPACELGQQDGVEDTAACGEALVTKVGRIEVQGRKIRPVCNTDTIRGDMPDTLNPGEAAAAGDLQCLNDGGGVLCVTLSRESGFFVKPGQYVILG
jgi:hypothetical protein